MQVVPAVIPYLGPFLFSPPLLVISSNRLVISSNRLATNDYGGYFPAAPASAPLADLLLAATTAASANVPAAPASAPLADPLLVAKAAAPPPRPLRTLDAHGHGSAPAFGPLADLLLPPPLRPCCRVPGGWPSRRKPSRACGTLPTSRCSVSAPTSSNLWAPARPTSAVEQDRRATMMMSSWQPRARARTPAMEAAHAK